LTIAFAQRRKDPTGLSRRASGSPLPRGDRNAPASPLPDLFSAGAKVIPQVLGCRVWEKLRRGCRRVGWRDAALRVFGQRHAGAVNVFVPSCGKSRRPCR